MEYFIIDNNGHQAGPFSLDQLVQKGITPETLVWKQGMADWTPAWKVDDMKAVLEAVEADKQNQATNNMNNSANNGFNPNGGNTGFNTSRESTGFNTNRGNTGFYHNNGTVPPNFSQQPQQEAYQSAPKNNKKKGHFALKVIIGLIVFIIAMLAFTNPSAEDHKEKVRTEAGKAIEKATSTTDNNFFSQALRSVAKMMADNVMGEAMDQLFEYHNYIVCSTGSVNLDGKDHTISFGILGKVYTMNADDMVKALENNDNLQIEESSSSSNDEQGYNNGSSSTSSYDDATQDNVDENSSGDNSSTSADNDDLGAKVQKKLEDKAAKALDKAADKVSKKMEEKINQKLNEVNDSSKIEKILDKILELF